jgi:hypothetical protein
MKTSSAVPRSRTDSSERSDRLKPGTSVSANAAVTSTQTLLKITSIAARLGSLIKNGNCCDCQSADRNSRRSVRSRRARPDYRDPSHGPKPGAPAENSGHGWVKRRHMPTGRGLRLYHRCIVHIELPVCHDGLSFGLGFLRRSSYKSLAPYTKAVFSSRSGTRPTFDFR